MQQVVGWTFRKARQRRIDDVKRDRSNEVENETKTSQLTALLQLKGESWGVLGELASFGSEEQREWPRYTSVQARRIINDGMGRMDAGEGTELVQIRLQKAVRPVVPVKSLETGTRRQGYCILFGGFQKGTWRWTKVEQTAVQDLVAHASRVSLGEVPASTASSLRICLASGC